MGETEESMKKDLDVQEGLVSSVWFLYLMFADVIHSQVISRFSWSVQVEQFCIDCLNTI